MILRFLTVPPFKDFDWDRTYRRYLLLGRKPNLKEGIYKEDETYITPLRV